MSDKPIAGDNDNEEVSPPTPAASNTEKWFEIAVVLLLAVTALPTAWSGYQTSLWDGIQSSSYTQASAARTNAAQQRTAANQDCRPQRVRGPPQRRHRRQRRGRRLLPATVP